MVMQDNKRIEVSKIKSLITVVLWWCEVDLGAFDNNAALFITKESLHRSLMGIPDLNIKEYLESISIDTYNLVLSELMDESPFITNECDNKVVIQDGILEKEGHCISNIKNGVIAIILADNSIKEVLARYKFSNLLGAILGVGKGLYSNQ